MPLQIKNYSIKKLECKEQNAPNSSLLPQFLSFLFSSGLCGFSCLGRFLSRAEIHTFGRIIVNLVFRLQDCFSILCRYNVYRTVWRHLPVPEIGFILIHIMQDSPAGTAMAGNQNSLVLPVRIVHQIIPERFGADTELFNGLSVRRRLEMKRVFVEILKMLRWKYTLSY